MESMKCFSEHDANESFRNNLTHSLTLSLQADISQEEFLSKYSEYLSRVNYRRRRSAKFYGDDVTDFVYGDKRESVKKIFTFKHSSE